MTDASINGGLFTRAAARPEPMTLPKPQPLGAPVLIYDCVTPVGGETLLSLVMKRMMQDDQP